MYVCTSVLALPICCLMVHRLVLFKHFHKCSVLVCGGDGSFGWVLATLDRLDMHDQVRAARSTAPTTQLCPPSLPLLTPLPSFCYTPFIPLLPSPFLISWLNPPFTSSLPSCSSSPPSLPSHYSHLALPSLLPAVHDGYSTAWHWKRPLACARLGKSLRR